MYNYRLHLCPSVSFTNVFFFKLTSRIFHVSDNFDIFSHAAFFWYEQGWYQILFRSESVKRYFQEGLNRINYLYFLFTIRFFWNSEQCFSLLLQDDSIGLKSKYQKGDLFFFLRESGDNLIIYVYHTIFIKFGTLFSDTIARCFYQVKTKIS